MIDFTKLTKKLQQFDSDLLTKIVETEVSVPCHLVITQGDNPNSSATSGQKELPVVAYGTVYLNTDSIINANDSIVVEKRDTQGTVLATYYGTAGEPTVKQSRKEITFAIDKVEQGAPEPPVISVEVEVYVSDGYGGYYWYSDGLMVEFVTKDDSPCVHFLDGWTISGGVYYMLDGSKKKLQAYANLQKKGTTEKIQLTADPFDDGTGQWYAKYQNK